MVETIMVMTGAIAVIRFLHGNCAASIQWMAVPAVLVIAALVPAWIRKREFPSFGLRGAGALNVTDRRGEPLSSRSGHPPTSRVIAGNVAVACVCVFPAFFLGLWVLTLLNLPVPLRPIVPERQGWLAWLLYQFFYVAVAEEVFFRGYVQGNAMRWLSRFGRRPGLRSQGVAILISAGCFALAHVIVQGQITPILTFLPGLVLGWLFLRTGSLLAPILFHGLANVSYAAMAMTLAQS